MRVCYVPGSTMTNAALRTVPCGRAVLAGLLASSIALFATSASAVLITVKSSDGPGEGFNDLTSVPAVGGNPRTSLGQQRMYLFQYAADIWGARLEGDIPIIVTAGFDNLGGTSVSATLGFAAPTTIHRDFLNAPAFGTWYVAAAANQLYGTDQNDLAPGSCPVTLVEGHCPEMRAQFNSAVDNQTVLGSVDFYYGVDGNSGNDIDFLTVVLHEMGHGLGVLSLADPGSGALYFGFSDAYSSRLFDNSINPKQFSQMTDLQRKSAMVHDGSLVLAGPSVKAKSGGVSAGRKGDGSVQVFAPGTFISGSSVSHFDTDVSPNELMEPYATNPPPRDLKLSLALLEDVGWATNEVARCGDANGDKSLTASDALMILKGAVGSIACPAAVCNVNGSGGVTAGDALILLKYAVGQSIQLACPLA
jgi:hypothetical protein